MTATEIEFKKLAIKTVNVEIKKNKYPCKIFCAKQTIVRKIKCEWCERKTLYISFSLIKFKDVPLFTDGHNNDGTWGIFKNKKWHYQSEWWVCGQCPNS